MPIENRAAHDLLHHVDEVLAAATTVLHLDDVGVMLLDEFDVLHVLGSTGPAGAALEGGQERLGIGPGVDTVRDRATIVVPDLAAVVAYAALWAEIRQGDGPVARSVCSAPVWVDDDVVGNFNAVRVDPGGWSAEETHAVDAYAGTVGILLRQAAWTVRSLSGRADGTGPR